MTRSSVPREMEGHLYDRQYMTNSLSNAAPPIDDSLSLGGDVERLTDYYRSWAARYDDDPGPGDISRAGSDVGLAD